MKAPATERRRATRVTFLRDVARETIRKTLGAGAMVLDHAGAAPNPARDRSAKLPREEPEEINPPSAEDVEKVHRRIPAKHRLALLWLDWSGARVSSVDLTLQGDYDESRRRVRLRATTTKTRKPLWVELHPVLAEAIEATLPHRSFRNPEARPFAGSGADALRTAIAKACKAEGIALWSPHDLRHRRVSLMHLRGVPWARIGESVGQRDLAVTANTYTHVMIDEAEVDYAKLLAWRPLMHAWCCTGAVPPSSEPAISRQLVVQPGELREPASRGAVKAGPCRARSHPSVWRGTS